MKSWIIKHKNEILVSIITAIIVGLLKIAWNFFIEKLPAAGTSVLAALKNEIYAVASRQTPSRSSALIILIAVASFTGVVLGMFATYISNEKIIKTLDGINKEIDKVESGDSTEEQKKELAKRIDKIKKKVEPSKQNQTNNLLYTYNYYSFILICICNLSSLLWNSFELSVTQIKPYISDSEIDSLCSKWTLMRQEKIMMR